MKVTKVKMELEIDSGNSALITYPGMELERILNNLAYSMRRLAMTECTVWELYDANGNHVGDASVSMDFEEDETA